MAVAADMPLVTTIAAGLGVALVLGFVTQKMRLSPILGYLLAGIIVGPYTPGIQADLAIAQQLAEIGVMLLMFGVGLHFHLKDLLAVKGVAVPGAMGQSALATGLGVLLAWALGWGIGEGLVLGIGLSVASTVVLMRGLEDSNQFSTPSGHIAVGWLIVEDLFTVIALVLLPAVTLGVYVSGIFARFLRASLIAEMRSDYVRTARAKGLAEAAVLFRHVLRNALIPILTGVVVVIPLLFMGSLLTESFFGIPGLGSYTIDAINAQDFAVVRAMVFIGSLLYIVGLILTDLSYTFVDPRIRFN